MVGVVVVGRLSVPGSAGWSGALGEGGDIDEVVAKREADPSMLDSENLAAFRMSVGTGQHGGDLVPLTNETPRLVLRLVEDAQ